MCYHESRLHERSYNENSTPSRPLWEVKSHLAWSVVRWVTTCEARVLFVLQPFAAVPHRQTLPLAGLWLPLQSDPLLAPRIERYSSETALSWAGIEPQPLCCVVWCRVVSCCVSVCKKEQNGPTKTRTRNRPANSHGGTITPHTNTILPHTICTYIASTHRHTFLDTLQLSRHRQTTPSFSPLPRHRHFIPSSPSAHMTGPTGEPRNRLLGASFGDDFHTRRKPWNTQRTQQQKTLASHRRRFSDTLDEHTCARQRMASV